MKFLFRKYPAKKSEVIEVTPSGPTTVKFMTAAEFKNYAGGRTHTYFKGRDEDGTIRFTLPFDSIWNAVVEKGEGDITAQSKLCPPDPSAPLIGGGRNGSSSPEELEAEMQSLSLGSRSEG